MSSLWILLCWLACSGVIAWDLYSEESQDIHESMADEDDDDVAADPVVQVHGRQKKEMQQEILSLLGLNHRPRPRVAGTGNSAPKFMIDLYMSISTESDEVSDNTASSVLLQDLRHNYTLREVNELNQADVVMSFPLLPKKHHKSTRTNVQRYEFDVSDVSPEDTVTSAEFRVYKHRKSKDGVFTISISQIIWSDDEQEKEAVLLESRQIAADEQGWLVFDVTNVDEIWESLQKDELKIQLSTKSLGGGAVDIHEVGILGEEDDDDKQPFVVAFFKATKEVHIRKTRGANRRKNRKGKNKNPDSVPRGGNSADPNSPRQRSCQKRSLYVSFKELGWQDWIIAPEGYFAFYCNGECSFPLNAHMNATNHAIVQTLVHLMDPNSVPKPCCAPTKLSAISVLYFDDSSNVILKKYRNMVVKSCGCH
ncbi:bone morphogenetic protein 7-like [Ptychodera flava]|uniref:bone morphogenetic protein 7-like n=1 Tax=Ptychodera flava TaxID=63121 RepID=UPI00396A77AD